MEFKKDFVFLLRCDVNIFKIKQINLSSVLNCFEVKLKVNDFKGGLVDYFKLVFGNGVERLVFCECESCRGSGEVFFVKFEEDISIVELLGVYFMYSFDSVVSDILLYFFMIMLEFDIFRRFFVCILVFES